MLHFETMLIPFGKRVLSLQQNGAQDINASTTIELLDNQNVLRTNTLYIGTAKMAAGLMEGRIRIEPSCFILIAAGSTNMLELPEQVLTSRVASAQIYSNLASLYNEVNAYMNRTFKSIGIEMPSAERNFHDFWHRIMEGPLNTKEGIR